MKLKLSILAFIVLAFLFSCSTGAKLTQEEINQQALVGKWETVADLGNQKLNVSFNFEIKDNILEGKASSVMGNGSLKNIKYDGKNITCFVEVTNMDGKSVIVYVDAQIQDENIEGYLTQDSQRVLFSGKKVK